MGRGIDFSGKATFAGQSISLKENLFFSFTENNVTLDELKEELNKVWSALVMSQKLQGSTYIRWGKSTCPSDAELIYSGKNSNCF